MPRSYVVFFAYYKHGDAYTETLDGDTAFRAFCEKQIEEYNEMCDHEFEADKITADEIKFSSMSGLIQLLIKIGEMIIANDAGYGVKFVARGSNMKVFKKDEDPMKFTF